MTPHFDAYLSLAAEFDAAKAVGAPDAVLDEIIEAQFDCWQDMSEADRAEARRFVAQDGRP